jgi:hypothetical protein
MYGCERLNRPNCKGLQENIQKLTEENFALKEKHSMLRHRLALYENPNTPPSHRMYPSKKRTNGGERFPGRPKWHAGKTRPKPKSDTVKAPELKERCERCGAPLGMSSILKWEKGLKLSTYKKELSNYERYE